jgi:hypothetical protein
VHHHWSGERLQRHDRRRQFHPVVAGLVGFATAHLADVLAQAQHRSPAARTGVGSASTVGVDDNDVVVHSVRPCLPEQSHGLRPDAVQSKESVEIRRQARDGAVTGLEKRASCGPADPDTVEDGTAIPGLDHALRISTPLTDCSATREVHD